MISIVILFLLAKKIGLIAQTKGENPLSWKIYLIVAWMIGELSGGLIVMYFFGANLIVITIFGVGLGLIGYHLVRQKLESIADIDT